MRNGSSGGGVPKGDAADPKPAAKQNALEHVVNELRAVRNANESAGCECRPCDLPSRDELVRIVDGLRAALYPFHFGSPDIGQDAVDYFVGHTLDETLRALQEQIRRGLCFGVAEEGNVRLSAENAAKRAFELTRTFAERLPRVRALLDSDLQAAYRGDPAARSIEEVLFCYPGITAVTHYRLAHVLYDLGVPLLPRIIAEIAHSMTGIDIHPGAKIGASFFIDHGTGVVIGETTVIGERVRLYQGVTLGAKSFPVDDDGTLVKGIARHPTLEDDVVVYAGATILGHVTIGHGSSIGGNVWLTRSVAPNSTVTQAQLRSETFDNGAGI